MRFFLYGFFLFCFSIVKGQQGIPFKSFQKHYVKGGTQLIGNTIVGEHPTKDFNKTNVLNDEVKIVYVDVDNDESTFSSSEATLQLPESATKITYAGLYWSGLYPAEKSKMRKGAKQMIYTEDGFRNKNIQNIQVKTGTKPYKAIEGNVIFDGSTTDYYKKDAPYVCYANVTDMFQNTTETIVTVANIRATQGFMEGGSAGGWVLYVVYEDPTQTAKYCTTFQGFQGVNRQGVNIIFDDFQTKNENKIQASILMAALEGDTKVKSDACLIYNPETENFVPLQNAGRSPKNFFTSTITSIGKTALQRNPASKNTLGLDIAKVAIPEGIMKPETTEIAMRWNTKADRFYLFFTAFETEIPKELWIVKQEDTTSNDTLEVETSIPVKTATPTVVGPPPIVNFVQPDQVLINREEPLEIKINTVEARPSIVAKGMKTGYYLVTNVFSNHENAISWKNYLNEQGFNARIFKGGDKQWEYVYIESSTSVEKMIERKEIINQFSYLTKIWVARVNF